MPLFRSKSLNRPPPTPSTPFTYHRKTDKLWGAMTPHGIGFSGPCQTPDFVPATVYLKSTTGSLRRPPRRTHQDFNQHSSSTTAAESWSDYSSTFSPQTHNVPLLSPAPTQRTQLTDLEVILRRTADGLGLRLIGGAEEGTQIQIGSVNQDSPAHRSGLVYPGDLVIAVNGVSLLGSTHAAAITLLDVFCRNPNGKLVEVDLRFHLRGYRKLNPFLPLPQFHPHPPSSPSIASHSFSSMNERRNQNGSLENIESIALSPSHHNDAPKRYELQPRSSAQSSSSSSSPNFHPQIDLNRSVVKVHLRRRAGETFGFVIQSALSSDRGYTIGSIRAGGPADRSRILLTGDKLLAINGHSLADRSHADIVEEIMTDHHYLMLTIERQANTTNISSDASSPRKNSRNGVYSENENSRTSHKLGPNYNPMERSSFVIPEILEPGPDVLDNTIKSPKLTNRQKRTKEGQIYEIILQSQSSGYGFSLCGGYEFERAPLLIRTIDKGTPAYDKMLVGDEVLSINGIPTATMTYAQAALLIDCNRVKIQLCLFRRIEAIERQNSDETKL